MPSSPLRHLNLSVALMLFTFPLMAQTLKGNNFFPPQQSPRSAAGVNIFIDEDGVADSAVGACRSGASSSLRGSGISLTATQNSPELYPMLVINLLVTTVTFEHQEGYFDQRDNKRCKLQWATMTTRFLLPCKELRSIPFIVLLQYSRALPTTTGDLSVVPSRNTWSRVQNERHFTFLEHGWYASEFPHPLVLIS